MENKLIISVVLKGGLGNQLFQISSAYGISLDQDKKLYIKDFNNNPHSNKNYFISIFRKLEKTNNCYKIFYEPQDFYSIKIDIPNFNYNVELQGYFQNEKYFKEYKNKIYDLFSIEEWRKTYLLDKYKNLNTSCFIHFRRGDYVNNPDYDIINNTYYENALNIIENLYSNVIYYIFSDDLNYCKNLQFLKNKKSIYVDENEINSLYLMSYCKIGGIGCNSSYSWWGGYLNENLNKIVIYPKKWHTKYQKNIDIYFEGSIIIDC